MYNTLVLGSGGREHALTWKLSQSPHCNKIFIAPGNAGTETIGQNISVDLSDFESIDRIVQENQIDLIVVGPEAPLVDGIYDYFIDKDVMLVGPSKEASQLEGSKDFANAFMEEFNIPTAGYLTVTKNNLEEGYAYIDKQPSKIVLKADGLAAGKGVLIIDDKEEAKQSLNKMLEGQFGSASEKVVIEEFLDGIEFSVFVLTDGKSYKLLPIAKDYKRIGEGDSGLNTGGMGAVSPVPFVDNVLMEKVKSKIIEPTIHGLQIRNYDYKGFIFLGLIMVNNEPYVIEYNCRLGDPETEVIIPRIKSDILPLLANLENGSLEQHNIEFHDEAASTIMLVSGGYPEAYEKGKHIEIDSNIEGSLIFHAGTKYQEGQLVTNGGRVIAVTSLNSDFREAIKTSLANISKIRFDKLNYRSDIGFDL